MNPISQKIKILGGNQIIKDKIDTKKILPAMENAKDGINIRNEIIDKIMIDITKIKEAKDKNIKSLIQI